METQKTTEVPPLEAILVVVATFFVLLFVGAILLLTVGEAATLVLGELLILIVPLGYLIYRRVNIREAIRINPYPKFLLIGIGCGGLLLLLNVLLAGVLTAIFGVSKAVEQSNLTLASLSTSPSGLAAVAGSLVLAGICEEFAFRGLLQNSLFQALNKNPKYSKNSLAIAVVISAATFGIFHFDPQFVYILATFAAGIALGYIYYKWGYTASATAHATMNLIVLALLLLGF